MKVLFKYTEGEDITSNIHILCYIAKLGLGFRNFGSVIPPLRPPNIIPQNVW